MVAIYYFTAPWCGPCTTFGPRIEKWAEGKEGVHLRKVNVDEEPELAEQYSVRSLPTTVWLRPDYSVSSFLVGSKTEQQLDAALSLARGT